MRVSITLPVLAAVFSSISVHAQDIDYNQIPARCRDVCNPVAALTQYCDRLGDDNNNNNNDDDGDGDDYITCVCAYPNANFQVPLCEACIRSVETDDNDVRDIIQTCRFTTTSYTTGATLAAGQSLTLTSGQTPPSTTRTTSSAGNTGSATTPRSTTIVPAPTTSTSSTSSGTSSGTLGGGPATTTTQLVSPASTSPVTSTTTTPGTGAAAATAVPLVGAGVMAAAAMAVLCGF